MGQILADNQAAPVTPAAGKSYIWVDSTTKKLVQMDDSGVINGIQSRNDATSSLAIAAADTYITNSGLLIPAYGMKAGQLYIWLLTATKTAAGTAATIFTVRSGAAQTTGDTSRLALTATVAQTAAVSSGIIEIIVHVRSVSATGVIVGGVGVQANSPGLGSGISGISGTFDNTAMSGLFLGLSINNGAAGAWTVEMVASRMM